MKLITIIIAVCALAGPVSAQVDNKCADRQSVLNALVVEYGETRQAVSLGADNSIVEIHASSETGSWTITVTHPNGITCMVAAGTAFELLNEPEGELH